MMTRTVFILLISSLCTLSYCTPRTEPAQTEVLTPVDSISKDSAVIMETLPPHIEIEKELLYDKHTLEDTYLYKDTIREFQWEKIYPYWSRSKGSRLNGRSCRTIKTGMERLLL